MDIKDLLGGTIAKQIGKSVGADSDAVGALLQQAVPTLLQSMQQNSRDDDEAEDLMEALMDHADRETKVEDVDAEDGAKIIAHLLGKKEASVKKNLAKSAKGLDADQVGMVLAMAAPLLMSAVGSQTKKKKTGKKSGLDLSDLIDDLSDGLDLGDIIKVASKLDADDLSAAAGLLGKLLK